ncbi:hypothetical protein Q5P01_018676 [Channa striata]|uniref:Uncharacterized protein n=1 Tax=Channa striata TaxID=64152 RepID=A0AA88M5B5_CHASR|nr:hypothetical protein Q5P01_018676 [Channa striata]
MKEVKHRHSPYCPQTPARDPSPPIWPISFVSKDHIKGPEEKKRRRRGCEGEAARSGGAKGMKSSQEEEEEEEKEEEQEAVDQKTKKCENGSTLKTELNVNVLAATNVKVMERRKWAGRTSEMD